MLLDLTEAVLELEDLVGRLADLGLALEDCGELRPALRLQIEAVERANRVLVLGVDLEHAPVAADGVVDVLELHLEDLREAEAELDEALRVLGELVELRVVERGDCGQRFTIIARRSRFWSVASLPLSSESARAYVSNADAWFSSASS